MERRVLVAALCLLASLAPRAEGLSVTYAHTKELAPEVTLHWTIEGEDVQLAIEAQASGWIGFGLAEVGGMKGADIVFYERATNSLTDTYAIENGLPRTDECGQDWTLRASAFEDGKMSVEMSRKLVTADPEDRSFDLDDSLPLHPTRVIAAWGDDQSVSYHGQNRVKGRVRFHQAAGASGAVSISERIEALKTDSQVMRGEILMDNKPIKAQKTEYHESCVLLADTLTSASPEEAYHIIAFEPVIDPRTTKYVHHYVVSVGQSCEGGGDDTFTFGGGTMQIVWLWAPGDSGAVLPPEAGVRILGGGEGFKAIHTQIHYDNPDKLEGLEDSSGFAVYYTSQLRQFDAGILSIGDPNVLLYNQPIKVEDGEGYSRLTMSNPANYCTDNWDEEEITVFDRYMHMHKQGERMVTRQMRDGELVRSDHVDYYDFNEAGGFGPRTTGSGFKIKKGDTFDITCYYHSPDRLIRFGLGSDDEMCIDFLYYYPLQSHSECNPSLGSLQKPVTLSSVGELGRTFDGCKGGASNLRVTWGVQTSIGMILIGIMLTRFRV